MSEILLIKKKDTGVLMQAIRPSGLFPFTWTASTVRARRDFYVAPMVGQRIWPVVSRERLMRVCTSYSLLTYPRSDSH